MTSPAKSPSTIKAIETLYKGYRFRSRLEARWSIFFDAIKMKYEYEKEGYDLDGTFYLPDFYLPELDCFIEIKGQDPTKDEENKATLLAKASGKNVFIFFGEIPYPDPDASDTCSAHKHDKYGGWDNLYMWCQCYTCGKFGIEFDGRADRLECKRKNNKGDPCPSHSSHGDKGFNSDSKDLQAAYLAARCARFEHGEKG